MIHNTISFGIDVVIPRIIELGMAKSPHEACGIIVPNLNIPAADWVIEMDNQSPHPLNSYKIDSVTIRGLVADPAVWDDVLIWHTHPSGMVGPSEGDYEARIEGLKYLVVALPGGQATMF